MLCDNDQSPSDASTSIQTGGVEDNIDSRNPIGTGVGYVSPTIVSSELPILKNKFKKNPPIAEVEVVKITNTSELMGNMDINKITSLTTENPTTIPTDVTTKINLQNSTNVSSYIYN